LGATLLFATLLFQSQSAGTAENLQRGKNAYDRGEYSRAVEIVSPLLYPEMHLQSDGQIIQAHRILGVSFLFENKKSEAEEEFHKLLQLVPDYRFDVAGDWYSNFCLATAGDMGYLKDPLCRYRTHAANVTSGVISRTATIRI